MYRTLMDTTPHLTEGPGKNIILYDAEYLCDHHMSHPKTPFPGPLLGKNMKKVALLQFIRRKIQECLMRDDEPEHVAAYVFWLIMEQFWTHSEHVKMTDFTPFLLQGYGAYINKVRKLQNDHWCLLLARQLLNSCGAEDELRESVIKLGDTLASRGQVFPAHVCYVVAQVELGSYTDRASFSLIGSGGLPFGKSAMREAFERTEVYEYSLWLTSGLMQPNFQIFKLLHASRLADSGCFAQARSYCRTISVAVATFPDDLTGIFMCRLIRLSEALYRGKAKEPDWLVNLGHLHQFKVKQIHREDCTTPERQEAWDVDSNVEYQDNLTAEMSTLNLNAWDLQAEMWDVDSVSDGDLMPEPSITYVNSAQLQPENWEVDSQSQDNLRAEMSTLHLNAWDLQAEMWDVDSVSDGDVTPEESMTYINTVKLQPEDWDADSEVQEMPTYPPSTLKFLTKPEAQEFLSQYTVGNLLGSGGFGAVYEGVSKKDGQQVAIKFIQKKGSEVYITIPGQSCKLHREVALMLMASKPPHSTNILKLLDWFDMPGCILLVLEKPAPCMDIFQLCMTKNGMLEELLAKIIMLQVVEATLHCHRRGVFHRDIKLENLLFNTETMNVKLIDFGCGDLWKDTPYRRYAGTRYYWPPEWLLWGQYNAYPATVWSLGVLLFSMVCGYVPFRTEDQIVDGTLNFRPGLSEPCRDLIKWCLEQDPSKRPSLTDMSEHEWFTEDF